jgi:hypothetical protein
MNFFRLYLIILVLFPFTFGLSAQSLVATDPLPKNAVLEEFTGIHCGYCPDGHAIGQALLDNNPNRVVIISMHQGTYAVPDQGEPDYRTSWGDSLAIQAGVTGYPMGTINRHIFKGSRTAMSRGDWTVSANQIMGEMSPVNVGVQSNYDSMSRELHIVVELYYTANSPQPTNRLNIALLQNHVYGPQLGGGSGNEYEHMHMLRDLITRQWGELILNTSQGSFTRREFIYQVPIQIREIPVLIEDCEIAVFVGETKQEIYTGTVVDAINGTNMYIGNVSLMDTVQIKKGEPNASTEFVLQAKSSLLGLEEFEFVLEANDAPDDWETSFIFNGQTYTDTAILLLDQNINEQIIFQIEPGESPGMVEYIVKMRSLSYHEAPVRYLRFYVISDVTDLVVNGSGGPESGYYDYVFTDGLESAGCNAKSTIPANVFVQGMHDRAFSDVKNIYLNIAWTFPSLTVEQIQSVKTFMDDGGNLMISGQDIGWDLMSDAANSHGSPEATDFYQNYLFADYLNDGNSSNNILYANTSDEVYSKVPNAFLVDIYNGNLYPDNIAARAGADEVFYYESNDKAAVVKATTNTFKVIYFACGFEMIGQVPITNQIMRQTYYWFNNVLSTEEYEEALAGIFAGQNYPNPASRLTTIPLNLKNDGKLKVFNIEGEELIILAVSKDDLEIVLDVNPLSPGLYFYQLITKDQSSGLMKLFVQ